MMVTVAKSLDVPIKLVFPRPAPLDDPTAAPSHAMLGLGDVVIPGIVVALALRFDLYLFYLRRQKTTAATTLGQPDTIEKPKYHSLAGRWTEHFWTHSLTGHPLWTPTKADKTGTEVPFTFPKTYFTAGLVGYILGMQATLGVMMIWNHAQPALLYLVPGVLGSLWLTALWRGEVSLMWNYTEEIIEEENEKKKDETAKGDETSAGDIKDSKTPTKQHTSPAATGPTSPQGKASAEEKDETKQAQHITHAVGHRPDRELFSFSIEAPWSLKKPRSVRKASTQVDKSDSKPSSTTSDAAEKHNWVPSTAAQTSLSGLAAFASKAEIASGSAVAEVGDDGHVGKRVRVKK